MEQRRILHVLNELNMGCIQAFLMNVYRNIDNDVFYLKYAISNNCYQVSGLSYHLVRKC